MAVVWDTPEVIELGPPVLKTDADWNSVFGPPQEDAEYARKLVLVERIIKEYGIGLDVVMSLVEPI